MKKRNLMIAYYLSLQSWISKSLMQKELQELSRWWREIGLASKLDFVRDRLMEWSNLCKAFLQEAKWSNNKIIPAFNDYLENASISSSGGALLAPSYFLVSPNNTNQIIDSLTNYYGLVRSSCTIFRLCNDLATSEAELERGETTNSITSYIYETRTSEEQARQNLRILIDTEWKKMNQERFLNSNISKGFMEVAINMARVSHCTYQYGDGLGRPDNIAQNRIKLLLIEPIAIDVTT